MGVALSRTKSIDGQDEEAKLHQSQTARLNNWITSSHRPVAVNRQHGRQLCLRLRYVSIGRHPHSRPALKDQLLDSIAVSFEKTLELRLERTRFFGKWSHRFEHRLAQLGLALFPFPAIGRRQIL